jgi:hypothetical protein
MGGGHSELGELRRQFPSQPQCIFGLVVDPETDAQSIAARVDDDVSLGQASAIAPASGVRNARKRPRRDSSDTSSMARLIGTLRWSSSARNAALDVAHMREHALGDRQVLRRQPILHGIEAVKPRDIEGRAQKAAAVRLERHVLRGAFQRTEARIPARVAGTRRHSRAGNGGSRRLRPPSRICSRRRDRTRAPRWRSNRSGSP